MLQLSSGVPVYNMGGGEGDKGTILSKKMFTNKLFSKNKTTKTAFT